MSEAATTLGAYSKIVAPFISAMDASTNSTEVNAYADRQQTVTITGISHEFSYSITDPEDCQDFLNLFTVSLADASANNTVSFADVGNAGRDLLKTMMQYATDASENDLKTWLESQAGQSIKEYILQTLGWSTSDLSGNVNIGFEAGAQSIVNNLADNAPACATMYMQLPQLTLELYMDVSDNGRLAPSTTALPLLAGDVITFVVDLNNSTGDVSVYWSSKDEVYALTTGTKDDVTVGYATGAEDKHLVQQIVKDAVSNTAGVSPNNYTAKYKWHFTSLANQGLVGNRRLAFNVKFDGSQTVGTKFNLKA